MGETDWAIVVGIQSYPGISSVDGPDNDANDFYDWLVDPKGGAVPNRQVKRITTTRPYKNASRAKPTFFMIEEDLSSIRNQARKRPIIDNHFYLGRRLYLFFAGHGFAPREEETALIMANATDVQIGAGFHWLGQRTANWFYKAGYFDEIVLLMDCCRNQYAVPELSWPWKDEVASDFAERVRRYYAFATRWSKETRGIRAENGRVNGKFTSAVLQGLRRATASTSNAVTTGSLSAFIQKEVPGLRPSDFIDDDFELVRVDQVNMYPVRVIIPPGVEGRQIRIVSFVNGEECQVAGATAVSPDWRLNLPNGVYELQVPEINLVDRWFFKVNGGEVPHVELR
jgi:hypothetical protein